MHPASSPASEPSGSDAGPSAPAGEPGRDIVLGMAGLRAHILILAAWLAGTAVLYVEAFEYNERARAFPVITFVTMAALVLARTGQVLRATRRFSASGVDRSRLVREATMIGWLVVAWVLVLLIGLIPGSTVLLTAYLAVTRPVSPLRILLIVVAVFVAIRVMFVELLNLPLQPGLLF